MHGGNFPLETLQTFASFQTGFRRAAGMVQSRQLVGVVKYVRGYFLIFEVEKL